MLQRQTRAATAAFLFDSSPQLVDFLFCFPFCLFHNLKTLFLALFFVVSERRARECAGGGSMEREGGMLYERCAMCVGLYCPTGALF